MDSFALCPLQRGYDAKPGNGLLEQDLLGGFARQRVQFVNNAHMVTASVLLNTKLKQEYFWTFWSKHVERFPQPFLWRLKVNDVEMTTYECQFVAGSLQKQEQNGLIYAVSFSVRCKQNPRDTSFDQDIIDAWEDGDPYRYINLLEKLVNEDLPETGVSL